MLKDSYIGYAKAGVICVALAIVIGAGYLYLFNHSSGTSSASNSVRRNGEFNANLSVAVEYQRNDILDELMKRNIERIDVVCKMAVENGCSGQFEVSILPTGAAAFGNLTPLPVGQADVSADTPPFTVEWSKKTASYPDQLLVSAEVKREAMSVDDAAKRIRAAVLAAIAQWDADRASAAKAKANGASWESSPSAPGAEPKKS
jgi:hypothetical protein